jgi:hypothetical protein
MVEMFGWLSALALRASLSKRARRAARRFFGKTLQRHRAMEFGILRAIDHTHGTRADLRVNAITPERLANHS